MGMPCEVNSVLKLSSSQGYPAQLLVGTQHQVSKNGHRIIPIDVPIPLVDANWTAYTDVVIHRLIWEGGMTTVLFQINRIYEVPFLMKV